MNYITIKLNVKNYFSNLKKIRLTTSNHSRYCGVSSNEQKEIEMKTIDLLTTAQAARVADVTTAAVHIWVKTGLLPAYTVALGTRGRVLWLIHPNDLAAMPRTQAARKRRRQQTAPATLPESVAVVHSTD